MKRERSSKRITVAIIVAIAVPVLYFLSMPPVILLWLKMGWPPEPLGTFYAPVVWLHENTFLREAINLYLRLWGLPG